MDGFIEDPYGPSDIDITGRVASMQLSSKEIDKETDPDDSTLTPAHYSKGFEPMVQLPHKYIPLTPHQLKKVPKLFYGFFMNSVQLVACAGRLNLFPSDHHPDDTDFALAISDIPAYLSKKYSRLLTSCVPRVGKIGGVIGPFTNRTMAWYFWGYDRDEVMLKQLREDLGLPESAQPMWWHMWADYDMQELAPKPDLSWLEREEKSKRAAEKKSRVAAKKARTESS